MMGSPSGLICEIPGLSLWKDFNIVIYLMYISVACKNAGDHWPFAITKPESKNHEIL